MIRYLTRVLPLASLMLSVGIGAVGCAAQTPEEKVASLRSRYKATMNGFIVQEEPIEVEAEPMMDPEGLEEIAAEDTPESLDTDEIPSYTVSTSVLLDILLQHDSNEKLDGVTVDISMIDAERREKGHWQVWFDTSTIEKANIVSKSHVLDDPGYEEGDGFAAEVRQQIPVSERSMYREFAAAN